MKNINDNVPYVLMSAFDISNYPEEMDELELKSFMRKPMHIDRLTKAIRYV